MHEKKHIVVTGTGRAGTTFVMGMLTVSGVDTGFTLEDIAMINVKTRAGLERDVFPAGDWPRVVKSIHIANDIWNFADVIGMQCVERFIVPIRDVNAAANSRRERQSEFWPGYPVSGGHSDIQNPKDVDHELLRRHYDLILAAALHCIPVTHLHYPRLVQDACYLYNSLQHIFDLGDFVVWRDNFRELRQTPWITQRSEHDKWP